MSPPRWPTSWRTRQRAPGFGLDSPLVTRGWAAVKTGTSKDMRDNWCLGFNHHYTVGVWVGNASGRPMHQVSGVSGAAPVWRTIMQALQALPEHGHGHGPGHGPGQGSAQRALPANELAPTTALGSATAFGVHSPRAHTVVVMDPDIPRRAQQMVMQGGHGQWWLNGHWLGEGERITWPLRPGRHLLTWRESAPGNGTARLRTQGAAAPGAPQGTAVEHVPFEVRAAPAPRLRPVGG
jgi:penicillin-binding protein 1C